MTAQQKQSLAYPLRLAANGGLELATEHEVTQDRIRSILETRPGEMIMRSNYGLSDQAFTAIPSPDVISERIRQAIEIQMRGQVSVFVSSQLTAEDGLLELQIDWQSTSSQNAEANRTSYQVVL